MSTDYFENVNGFEDINGRDVLGGHANANGRVLFTRPRRHFIWPSRRPRNPRPGGKPGSRMIASAMVLLFVLGAGLLAVSLAAQYRYLQTQRHQHWASLTEALALDVGMLIFSLLALGLARSGKPARAERVLIMVCAAGSAVMNYAASDVGSARSVLAFVMPPVFLAVVADRVIAVIRQHLDDREQSAWATAGHGAGAVLRGSGIAALYALRLVLAPRSTLAGGRRAVLLATPVPAAEEPPAIEAAPDTESPSRFAYCAKCGRFIMRSPSGDWLGADNLTSDGCRHSPVTTDDQDDEDLDEGSAPRPGTKTAAFLVLVTEKYGLFDAIDLERVSPIAAELAPQIGLNAGSARRELRKACLAARLAEGEGR